MAEVNNDTQTQEISLKDVFKKIASVYAYLKSKRLAILVTGLLGAALGLTLAIVKKPVYTATSTFVVEDESGGGGLLSQYSGLASLAGLDVGKAGGIFQGDNILELYRSRKMIETALLSEASFDGKNQLLIDRYISYNKFREKWAKDGLQNITFTGDPENFNRKQDSIITDFANDFNTRLLSVTKPDKKLSIINVSVSSKDELFAKAFNTRLVETVNKFYGVTKTKKSSQNIAILQRQADSMKRVLGYSISGVASAIDAAPNANPALLSLRVPSQKKQIDVQANTAIYSEIVKNLEVAKVSFRQQTPLIQMIDQPVLPLPVTKIGKIKGIVLGLILGMILATMWFIAKKILKAVTS